MKKNIKKVAALFLAFVMLISIIGLVHPETVMAAQNITRAKFVELVVKELGLKVDKKEELPYIAAALREKIISKTTFGSKQDYNAALTKSDAAVILVRADEYLNGVTVSDELVQTIIAKRISDIGKVSDARKPYVAKAFAMGYLSGASNGKYSTDRKFDPGSRMTLTTAKTLVERIKNKDKRVPMSPDGQVLRTTNLPSNADKFPYILASYPNEYYEWDFSYMCYSRMGIPLYGTSQWVNLENYAAPVDVSKWKGGKWWETDKQTLEAREELVRKYLMLIFNVDYRTIRKDIKWQEKLKDIYYLAMEDITFNRRMGEYLDLMEKNKTIIECDKVAVDKSTYYISSSDHIMRVYVHFRINSAKEIEKAWGEYGYSTLVFNNSPYATLTNVKVGQWINGYFDVKVNNGNYADKPSIYELWLCNELSKVYTK